MLTQQYIFDNLMFEILGPCSLREIASDHIPLEGHHIPLEGHQIPLEGHHIPLEDIISP